MVMSFSIFSVSAEAISVYVTESNYGNMVPTNYNFTKEVSTVYLYGNYDYINFKIDSNSINNFFFFEIYADADYTKPVYSDYAQCDMGYYNYTPYINMIGKFSSKTYYAITYAASIDYSGNIKISQPSVRTFKIVVNRLPKYNQQVVGLKSTTNTVHGPQISWYKLSDSTTKYYIYRRYNYSSNAQWKLVGTVNGSTYSFIDKSTKNTSAAYIYTVKGQDKNGLFSRYHYNGVASSFVQAPVISYVATCANNTIQIKWNRVNLADSYYLYRRVNNGNWVLLCELTNNVYNDTSVVNGNNYKYTVRAKKSYTLDSERNLSAYYAGKGVDYIQLPEINEPKYSEDGMTISWNAVQGADKYAIYRKSLEPGSTWKILGRVDGNITSYVDKTAVEEGAYRYTVRSEGKTNQGSYYSEGVCYVNLTQPQTTVTLANSHSLLIKWDKVEYATSYNLMCNDGSGWKKYCNTGGCEYWFYYPQNTCKEYKFSVMPLASDMEGTYKTDVESVVTFPQNNISTLVYNDYIKLYWRNIKADRYDVYRKLKDSADSEYLLIDSVNTNAYNDYSAEDNVNYTYTVRAVYNSVVQEHYIPNVTAMRLPVNEYINGFRAVRAEYTNNRTGTVHGNYEFKIEKTDKGQDAWVAVYGLGKNGWVTTDANSINYNSFEYNTEKPTFYVVANNRSGGATPIDSYASVVENEMCAKPTVSMNVTQDGLVITIKEVDGAVAYRVQEKDNNLQKTVEADGSDSYTIVLKSLDFKQTNNLVLYVSAIHSNGNVSGVMIDNFSFSFTPPQLMRVKSEDDGNIIYWSGKLKQNHIFHVFRKAPGDNSWVRVGYTNATNFKDKTAVSGVKYVYTVRDYDYANKFYASSYNTDGLEVGGISTPKLIHAIDCGNHIAVAWEKNLGAEGYYVYRRTEGSTNWTRVYSSRNSSYVNYEYYTDNAFYKDYSVISGQTYYYTVITYDGTVMSDFDKVGIKCKNQ